MQKESNLCAHRKPITESAQVPRDRQSTLRIIEIVRLINLCKLRKMYILYTVYMPMFMEQSLWAKASLT